MKKFVFFLIVVFAIPVSGCKKGTTATNSSGSYKGVIIKNTCCQIVIQTIGPNYLGQMNWRDGFDSTGTVYSHVFKVSNPCQFGNHMPYDTINFKIVPMQVQNCACCMVFTNTPDTSYAIEVVN